MRIAVEILTATATEVTLRVLEAAQGATQNDGAILTWSRKGKNTGLPRLAADLFDDNTVTVQRAVRAFVRTFNRYHKTTGYEHTPLTFFRSIIFRGGVQVVWDVKADKYRNVSSMKAADDVWEADGTGITVESSEEAIAQRSLAKEVTAAMAKRPQDAVKLAAWFANKMPVKKTVSGAPPEAIDWKLLAAEGESTEPTLKKIK